MTFEDAVRKARKPVPAAFERGKGAIKGEHRGLIECKNPRRFTGSIDLDNALAVTTSHCNSNRWDYGIGFLEARNQESALWFEVHSASTSEVTVVLKKLKWLKTWLQNEAPELGSISRRPSGKKAFHWLATRSGTHIPRNSRQARLLAQSGLDFPRRKIILD